MMLAAFLKKWGSSDYLPDRVADAELRTVEEKLGWRLPDDYRNGVLEVGLPRPTLALLDTIVDRELDMHAIGDFYSPVEILEETFAWRELGLPDELIAFASDGLGNKFCFSRADNGAVWFFDHDLLTIERVALSFADWLAAYCNI